MRRTICIAKVGGSLYDLPDLADRLQLWLRHQDSCPTLFVPGGGLLANAVRDFDRVHRLGEEASHWLALAALSVAAAFVARLVPGSVVLPRLPEEKDGAGPFVVDPLPFFRADETEAGRFPHSWQVTSDSLAVRVAARARAEELVLLKSVSWAGGDWQMAARQGIVDGFFPEAIQRASGLKVRVVNMRQGAFDSTRG
jgi:aspartokinase-like uncharacterized kinase